VNQRVTVQRWWGRANRSPAGVQPGNFTDVNRTPSDARGAVLPRRFRSLRVLLTGGALLAGCQAQPTQTAPSVADRCLLSFGSADDTVTIGISGDVRASRAAKPQTDAERVLSHLLYETLIEIDCEGRVRPGLAASWRSGAGGMEWVFTLRDGVTYSDGASVTAGHIEAAWRNDSGGAALTMLDAVVAAGEHELRVMVREAFPSVPRLLADPQLAVRADRGGADSWPVGTRGYAVQSVTDTDVLIVPVGAMGGDDLPVVRLVYGDGDLRDLIDARADLVITRELRVVDYARSASGYRSVSLPWSRTYGLVVGTDSIGGSAWRDVSDALRTDLAEDPFRPPRDRYWWDGLSRCREANRSWVRDTARSDRLVYRGSDPVARDLAERLVALGSSLPPHAGALRGAIAAGLSDLAFERALAVGSDRGYIVELPTGVLDPCGAAFDVTRSIPWIDAEQVGSAIIPLAEARFTALVRNGAGPFVLGWDGLPVFRAAVGRSP